MLFSADTSLEDLLVEFLLRKSLSAKELHALLKKHKISVSIQGIYNLLNNLIDAEVVIKTKTVYSLSEEWRRRMADRFMKRENNFELSDGEILRLNLNSLVHLDMQWKNILFPLQDSGKDPLFISNVHGIWFHLSERRKASQHAYFSKLRREKTPVFYSIAGTTKHDLALKKQWRSESLQINTGREYFGKTDYVTIIDDYIITTRISPSLTSKIEECYEKASTIQELEEQIYAIGIEKKKVKLIVERNRDKARTLRKRIAKDFFVSKELREKFDLY